MVWGTVWPRISGWSLQVLVSSSIRTGFAGSLTGFRFGSLFGLGFQVGSLLTLGFGFGSLFMDLSISGFGFLISLLGGVFSWKNLARVLTFLLGALWGVEGRVSWCGFLVGGRFGSWGGFGFLGLDFDVFAKPVCVIKTRFESSLMNILWFVSGWGLGFGFWFGLGRVFMLGFLVSRLNLGVLGVLGVSFWFLSGLRFLFGVWDVVGMGWVQANLPLGSPLLESPIVFSLV